jgi:hypothetical protein
MTPKKTDELTLGATYLCVPRKDTEVRKARRKSLAPEGELVVLDTHWTRRAKHGEVLLFDPSAPVAPTPEPELPAAQPEEAAPAEEPNATPAKRRAKGE